MDITSNPWIVTAADVAAAGVTVWPTWCNIYNIEFTQYNGDGDSAETLNLNNLSTSYLDGSPDKTTKKTNGIGQVYGVKVALGGITSGEIRIYHK